MEKNQKLVPGTYLVNKDKKTVVYAVEAHGRMFVGKAKCKPNDEFNEQTGKVIAHMHAVLAQRKFDLELTRRFLDNMKGSYAYENARMGTASPHYMRAIQAATEEEKAQLAHIKDLKNRINEYM